MIVHVNNRVNLPPFRFPKKKKRLDDDSLLFLLRPTLSLTQAQDDWEEGH